MKPSCSGWWSNWLLHKVQVETPLFLPILFPSLLPSPYHKNPQKFIIAGSFQSILSLHYTNDKNVATTMIRRDTAIHPLFTNSLASRWRFLATRLHFHLLNVQRLGELRRRGKSVWFYSKVRRRWMIRLWVSFVCVYGHVCELVLVLVLDVCCRVGWEGFLGWHLHFFFPSPYHRGQTNDW